MKNISSTEVLTLLAILLFCYGGESVCENPIDPKITKILRNNLVVSQNVYLELQTTCGQQNRVFFGMPTIIFFNKKNKTLTF